MAHSFPLGIGGQASALMYVFLDYGSAHSLHQFLFEELVLSIEVYSILPFWKIIAGPDSAQSRHPYQADIQTRTDAFILKIKYLP